VTHISATVLSLLLWSLALVDHMFEVFDGWTQYCGLYHMVLIFSSSLPAVLVCTVTLTEGNVVW